MGAVTAIVLMHPLLFAVMVIFVPAGIPVIVLPATVPLVVVIVPAVEVNATSYVNKFAAQVVFVSMSSGVSLIVTDVLHVEEFPQASVTVHAIAEVPIAKAPLAFVPVPVLLVAPVMAYE